VSAVRRRAIELGCLALGAAVLATTLWRIGLDSLTADLRVIGWGLVAILMVESFGVGLNTVGWAFAFPRGERTVSVRRLLAARLAGDGVNYLTPSATIGGELLRVRLLGHRVPIGVRWGSVSVAKIGQSVAQAVFVLLGVGLVLPRVGGGSAWLGWLVGGVAAVVVTAAFFRLMARGVWATLAGLLRRVRLLRLLPGTWAGPGRDLDAALVRLGAGRTVASLACFLAGWFVGAAEIYVILRWLGGAVDWQTALAIETGSVLIDGMLFFVPAKMGTQEGGKVVLFALFGLSPARGLTVGVVRRIRELVYASVGLLALACLSARAAARGAGVKGIPARPGA
jgi:hypothetical protein